jgi:hypothetical protein
MHSQLGEEWIENAIRLGEKSLEKMLGLCILVVDALSVGLGSQDCFLAALGEVVDIHEFQILDEILRIIYNL